MRDRRTRSAGGLGILQSFVKRNTKPCLPDMLYPCLPADIAIPTANRLSFQKALKRALELTLVLVTLPLWLPLCLLIYVLIWVEDRNNPLFIQERIGEGGRVFKTFKFRTMVPDAEAVLKQVLAENEALRREWDMFYKLRKDPRITRIGAFLRRTSLDELPQLLNVLRGDMALVGPRPLTRYHQDALPAYVRTLRESVKPGMTGLWQVSGRSDAGTEGMKKYDPLYVLNWSLALDAAILARTVGVVLKCEGAY